MKTKEEILVERKEKGFCTCQECIDLDIEVQETINTLQVEGKL